MSEFTKPPSLLLSLLSDGPWVSCLPNFPSVSFPGQPGPLLLAGGYEGAAPFSLLLSIHSTPVHLGAEREGVDCTFLTISTDKWMMQNEEKGGQSAI